MMSTLSGSTRAQETRRTYVYKVVQGCQIKADVFGAAAGANRAAVIWLHGGGLIFGSRTTPRPVFLEGLLEAGVVVISIDYRLAPETKLAEIVEDALDAWRWVREEGPAVLGIDPDRIAMAGGSSGAYLALLAGFHAFPRPRALASFWGFGDITTPWEAEPSAYYLEQELISREQALLTVGVSALSEQIENVDRAYFYLYCRQQGLWPIEVTGHDPRTEPRWFDEYCPVRNITPDFPPTILIHGTADMDVPYEESEALAARLNQAEVPHDFVTVAGAGHGLAGVAPDISAAADRRAVTFLLQQLAST